MKGQVAMKTKTASILGAFAALALAFAPQMAKANLIYWMVNDANYNGNSIAFTYATIKADGVALYAYNAEGATDMDMQYNNAESGLGTGTDPAYFGSFGDSVSSFLVELWDEDNDSSPVGWQTYSAAELADYIWKGDATGGSGASYFTVSNVIPEPSSGLMLLLGGALLALRRRRAAC